MTQFFLSNFFLTPFFIKVIFAAVAIMAFKYVAAKKGRSQSLCTAMPVTATGLSLLLTHSLTSGLLIIYVVLIVFCFTKSRNRQCPECKENVIREAMKCKHCGSSINPV
jgi:hypothetical protein